MAREGREVWAKRVERWVDSGLTAKEFTAETGVNANTLAHWCWRLGAKVRAGRAEAATAPVRFVEIAAAPPTAEGGGFGVVLAGGRTVRVPPPTIRATARAVSERRPAASAIARGERHGDREQARPDGEARLEPDVGISLGQAVDRPGARSPRDAVAVLTRNPCPLPDARPRFDAAELARLVQALEGARS